LAGGKENRQTEKIVNHRSAAAAAHWQHRHPASFGPSFLATTPSTIQRPLIEFTGNLLAFPIFTAMAA